MRRLRQRVICVGTQKKWHNVLTILNHVRVAATAAATTEFRWIKWKFMHINNMRALWREFVSFDCYDWIAIGELCPSCYRYFWLTIRKWPAAIQNNELKQLFGQPESAIMLYHSDDDQRPITISERVRAHARFVYSIPANSRNSIYVPRNNAQLSGKVKHKSCVNTHIWVVDGCAVACFMLFNHATLFG